MRVDRLAVKVLCAAALLAGSTALAQDPGVAPVPGQRPAALVLGMGWDRGSEELISVDLDDGTTQTLRANGGFYFEAGVAFLRVPLGKVTLDTTTTIGVKGWSVGGSNGSLDYLAFPLEVVERVAVDQFRFGAGLSFLLGPKLSSSGVLEGNDVDLKNSMGIVFQTDWIGKRTPGRLGGFLGARFVWQKLEGENGVAAVSANALGLRVGLEY